MEHGTPSFHALRFGRAAENYESAAHIQLRMAEKLLALWGADENPGRMVEFGCGTGLLTRRLLRRFPDASLFATDASAAMLAQAPRSCGGFPVGRIAFAVQDASGICAPSPELRRYAPFDLATSNAVTQWLPDLTGHLTFVADLCSPRGVYLFSGFAPDNFPELNALLAQPPFSYRNFPGHDPEAVRRAAEATGWKVLDLEAWEETETLPAPLDALRRIQKLGSSRDPHTGGRLTRRNLQYLLAAYADRFAVPGGVSLTWRPWIARLQR